MRKLEEEVGLIFLDQTKNTLQGRAEGLARKLESNNKGFAMLVRVAPSTIT